MKAKTMITRLTGAALFAALLGLVVVQTAQAEPDRRAKRRSAGFDLRAGATWNMETNRVACGLDSQGNVCTDVTGSPTGGGGFWPGGPPMQYIFNSGLQIAGIIADDAPIWAGDTVGAFFFDASGLRPSGQQVTDIWSSVNPSDLENWPTGAYVQDGNLYDAALLGRKSVSQEDTWVRYWDGPSLMSGRQHPMGILVEQRGLAWNYPAGNEDILYFMYTFTNISASDPAAYSSIDPMFRDEIAATGAEWVATVENLLGIDIPSQGYRIDSVFGAFAMDPDVGNASENSSTAILPFSMGIAYKNDFDEPTWLYPPEINGPPFGPYPGFIGVKYLKSPLDPATGEQVGLTMFSNTTNGGTFPDPNTTSRLWRYLAGEVTLDEGDPICDINPPRERKLCALRQAPVDTRFFQASGPFSLNPGEQGTIVVAYVHAAPIAAEVLPYYRGVLAPGIPPNGEEIHQDDANLRVLERAAGWVSHQDDDDNSEITQEEVNSVEYSLLWKSMVAQSLFDAKFLLPFAPESPPFYLVPGDNSVTVVWQPSPTETIGDPYYAIAANPASPLADANYGDNDVEGYRIYRGRNRAQMELVAQFDYSGTTFDDYRGLWAYTGRCAPELGILDDCPADFPLTPGVDTPVRHDLFDAPFVPIEMVRPGGRVELIDGSVFVTETFNPVSDAGFPTLDNTGVPFAYVDNSVVNSVGYYYSVTAFDVNSIASGPGTLESALATQPVYPRKPAPNLTNAVLTTGLFGRGVKLDENATFDFDGTTGMFSGGVPPASNLSFIGYDLFAPTALELGAVVEFRVDSVIPFYYDGTYYMTLNSAGQTSSFTVTGLPEDTHDNSPVLGPVVGTIPADAALAAATGNEGLPFAGSASFRLRVDAITWYSGDNEWHKDVDGAFWTAEPLTGIGGSRWFDGDDEATPQVDGEIWRGSLTGVNIIQSPQPNWGGSVTGNSVYALFRRIRQGTWQAARQADVKFYWGSTPGTLDSVIDVTHNVPVEFLGSRLIQAGWGFRDDIAGQSRSYTPADGMVSEYDFIHGPCADGGVVSHSQTECANYPYLDHAVLQPVDATGDGVADGNGFALYFNHEFYIFQTDALPSDVVWTHRSFYGLMDGSAGAYTFTPKPANAAVPGLSAAVRVDTVASPRTITAEDLELVHTVPDPYYVTSGLEVTPTQKVIKFINLPERAIIRIYSVSGVLVDVIEHYDQGLGGEATWNVRNRNNQFVASGVYFYHVETEVGETKIGRFTVINASGLAVGQANQ